MAEGQYGFASSLDNAALLRQAEEAKDAFRDISKTASDESGKIDNAFKNIGKAVAGYFSAKAAADFGKQIVKVRGEIESLEVSFKTLLGDEKKAIALMADIRKFAASTPMQMNDLAAGAQTLLGFNVEAEKVMPTLQALGDISMGDSQKFNSLTLAFAQMSSTGKLMGQDLLQMINAGFNPLVQIAERTGKSVGELKEEMSKGKISVEMVTQAFMDATAVGGKFHGMLEKQSQGIQGSLSNVQGALNDMLNDLGEKIQEPVTDGLQLLQQLIQHYEEVGKVIGVLVATYGGYKAAVMAYNAAMVVANNLTKGYTVAQQIEYVWLLLVEKAQALLNKTMLANPFILAATAIIALISALVLLKKRTSEAEKAQNALNNAVDGSKKRTEDLKTEANDLIAVLDDENATEAQHKEALDKLISLYPELLKGCKTYNDYLERRKAIIEGMPKAQEERENETLEESIALMEQYIKVKNDYIVKSGETYQQHVNRIHKEYGSEQKQYELEIELKKKIDIEYQKWKEAGNKGALDEYVRLSLEANKKVLDDRIKIQRKAEFDAKPIEERIEITESSIRQAEASLLSLKRKAESDPWNAVLNLNILMAERQLTTLHNQLNNLTEQKPIPVKIDFGKAVRDAEKALTAARKKYRADASETNKKAVADAQTSLDSAKTNYKNAYGKDYEQAVKAGKDRSKAQKEAIAELKEEEEALARWLVKQARQQGIDEEQARIDGMKNGYEKELAQLELAKEQRLAVYEDYKEELLEKVRDLAEAQWKAQNPDKVKAGEKFNRNSVSLGEPNEHTATDIAGVDAEGAKKVYDAILNAHKLLIQQERLMNKQNANDQQAILDRQLSSVKTYQQRREDIEREYADKRASFFKEDGSLKDGITQGNVDELDKQRSEALASVDEEIASRSDAFKRWSNELTSLTVRQLKSLLEVAKKTLNTLSNDPDADPKKLAEARAAVKKLEDEISAAALTPSEEQMEEWNRYCDHLEEAGNALKSLGDAMGGVAGEALTMLGTVMSSTSSMITNIQKVAEQSMKAMESTADTTSKAIAAAQSSVAILAIIQAIYTTVVQLRDFIDNNFEADSGFAQFVSDFLHFLTDSETMLANLAWSLLGPLGTIIGVLTSANKNSDRQKHLKELEQLTEEYNNVGDACEDLGKQAEKTFGASNAEIRKQQIELKRAQQELLRTAIAEEQAMKDPDEDKISEWQNQINQIQVDINDLGTAAVDAIYGEDIKSAIENFGDSLIEAWESGMSASESANDYMRSMIKKTVTQAILDYVQASARIDAIRAKLKEYLENDGIISEDEQADLERMAQQLMDEVGQEFEWAQRLFDDSGREGAKKGIAVASQESVDENNGRLTFIQGAVTIMKEHTLNISDNSNLIRDNVAAIMSCLLRVENSINVIKSILGDMQLQGVRIRS